MLEQLVVLFLIGLGIKTPTFPVNVLGDTTEETHNAVVTNAPEELHEDKNTIRVAAKEIHEDRQAVRTDVKNLQEDLLKNRRRKEASRESEIRNKDFLATRKALGEKFMEEVKNKRASAAAAFKAQREAFKSRLSSIRNTAKQEKLKNLDTLISQANTNRTTAMTNQLNRMDQLLANITSGLSTLSAGGQDTTAAQNAVNAAMTAISAAKSAVSTQAGKEYVIGITTENNLGNDVGRTRSQLEADLRATHATVTQAHQAVAAAIRAYAQLKGEATNAQ